MIEDQSVDFPYKLQHPPFFQEITFKRGVIIDPSLNLETTLEVRIEDEGFPAQIQVDIHAFSNPNQPLEFDMVLTGVFSQVEEHEPMKKDDIPEFVKKRALFMMWPYLVHVVREISLFLGVAPLRIPTPYHFPFEFKEISDKK